MEMFFPHVLASIRLSFASDRATDPATDPKEIPKASAISRYRSPSARIQRHD
jgi:hypothetical protein